MKSQKLTNAIRDRILDNIYNTKIKPDLDKFEKQLRFNGGLIIRNAFGDGVYDRMLQLPENYFSTKITFRLNVDGKIDSILTDSVRCPACYLYDVITTDDRVSDKSVHNARNMYRTEYRVIESKRQKVINKWQDIREEATKIIYSVNTTKQLIEMWPEVVEFLPDGIKSVDTPHLPMVQVEKLNTLLGIKGEQNEPS